MGESEGERRERQRERGGGGEGSSILLCLKIEILPYHRISLVSLNLFKSSYIGL